jgi:hypothetical protein
MPNKSVDSTLTAFKSSVFSMSVFAVIVSQLWRSPEKGFRRRTASMFVQPARNKSAPQSRDGSSAFYPCSALFLPRNDRLSAAKQPREWKMENKAQKPMSQRAFFSADSHSRTTMLRTVRRCSHNGSWLCLCVRYNTIRMKESGRSLLRRHTVTAFFVGCSIGGSSIITGIVTGEHNRFVFSGLLVFIATVSITAGVASLTLKNYLTIDPKTHQIVSTPGGRWAMAILWIIGGTFLLFLAGMYYSGEDPLNIPKKQTEQAMSGNAEPAIR